MIYEGQTITCRREGTTLEIVFDNKKASVNKFDRQTMTELGEVVTKIRDEQGLTGAIFASAKDVFFVGADITEFIPMFKEPDQVLKDWLGKTHSIFNEIEDWPFPSVSLINGVCLGGGAELTLATTYRVGAVKATMGFPETKLGIYPGWGGVVRLPKIIGIDNALEWIAGGGTYKTNDAYKVGFLDAYCEPEKLLEVGHQILAEANSGNLPWQKKQQEKIRPLALLSELETAMAFVSAKGVIAQKAAPHYPAPLKALEVMHSNVGLDRAASQANEINGFISVAKTPVAEALISIFLADQYNKKSNKSLAAQARPVKSSAVVGAGIMGGGIAYQSASRRVPVIMKDINHPALELGLTEAGKLLTNQMKRGKIDATTVAMTMGAITPTLTYGDFKGADVIVEAVVENLNIKQSVLAELESACRDDAIITSNTSTISIDLLAKALNRPENFCGMHFFNPVHRMPLVEVIRGSKTSETTIATVVAYATQMGKTPVVVQDCPGFLVNRVLFPYFAGLFTLLDEGVDFTRIDKVMEHFGWPMGPAYLLDVIGLDTAVHAHQVMAAAFPERMKTASKTATEKLVAAGRLGQKNGKGFYRYETDKRGKPKKLADPTVAEFVKPTTQREATDEEIVWRMMVPMLNECALCLEEKIVATPMELDLALIYGIGFPPFRGGALKFADTSGISQVNDQANQLASYGAAFAPAPMIKDLAQNGGKFYQV